MRIRTLFFLILLIINTNLIAQKRVEKWNVFELELKGKRKGNPFTEINLRGRFYHEMDTIDVSGFYDGNGVYKIRFMPQKEGVWKYVTKSNDRRLNKKKGKFLCISAGNENHGLVKVEKTYHFAYSDGQPFYPLGTTAYGWIQQKEQAREQTLVSLRKSPFNKVRIALLPHAPSGKTYDLYPYKGSGKKWDFTRFNPEYFRRYETYIMELQKLGIQVDLFVFHPYDKGVWGFDTMNKKEQFLYLNYVNSRFGAFRNIWWSMSNEFDLLKNQTMEDWNGYFQFFYEKDPYNHLRSIHNAGIWYDHRKPWVTHISAQSEAWWRVAELRKKYQKPLIYDEFCYEGNGDNRTVALNGDAITHRFWLMTISGAFASHGEGFTQPNTGYQFFRQGGKFVGNSIKGLKILKEVIDDIPGFLEPQIKLNWRLNRIMAKVEDRYFLYYLGDYQNSSWTFDELPDNKTYTIDLIETKKGNTSRLDGTFSKGDKVVLPGKPYMAMVLRLVN